MPDHGGVLHEADQDVAEAVELVIASCGAEKVLAMAPGPLISSWRVWGDNQRR